MFYLAKTPRWVRKLLVTSIWEVPDDEKAIYLTFDDGPHPSITPFVLNELDKYGAKATFFCIGKNVEKHGEIYRQILDKGHAVGNHTHNHLNGWKTADTDYLKDILNANRYIDSDLFRPPYGRITWSQHKQLTQLEQPFKIVMWSVLSGDFDVDLSPEKCYKNVVDHAETGSIIVFHDSEKAERRLNFALPAVLKYFSERGYVFKKIE